ncbi:MAG TPA: M67 family metallopeptidase [Candidatus Sulfotelmatobacter sp.]|nr:M67 family metallopeptidase [Candidatus Sulfotelmatobacter sp.]
MLHLAQPLLRRLVEAGEAAYPEEACALLVGRGGIGDIRHVERIELSANVADDRQSRFEVDPGLRIGLERELRGGSRRIVGVWHSHPDGAAAPSATDAAMAFEPDLVWLITAVAGGQAVASAAFAVNDHGPGFRPLALLSD